MGESETEKCMYVEVGGGGHGGKKGGWGGGHHHTCLSAALTVARCYGVLFNPFSAMMSLENDQ